MQAIRQFTPYLIMIAVYGAGRVLFYTFPTLKTAFIYPSGWLVQSVLGPGEYVDNHWQFVLGNTRFLLDASCSGTTFFCLLLAYFAFRRVTHGMALYWFMAAFPIVLLANTARVVSSIYMHSLVKTAGIASFADSAHVLTGTFAFLCTFLLLAYYFERSTARV